MTQESRTPPSKMAKQLVKYLRPQRPNYNYLRDLFRHLRKELEVSVTTAPKKLPLIRGLKSNGTKTYAKGLRRHLGDGLMI